MSNSKYYSKAPITEALLDIRVRPSAALTLSSLASIQQEVSNDYPDFENTLSIENNLTTGQSVITQTKTSLTGFRFWHKERKYVFQARLDGFTFSRLSPYENWAKLKCEAQKTWNAYTKFAEPQSINRIAVRYINKINLPLPVKDFADYLRITPEVSNDLPQGVSDYLMQLRIPEENLSSRGLLSLTEAVLPNQQEQDFVSILLDIDLSCEVNFQTDADNCWSLLEEMHIRKNQIFEACITDKVRELIS